MNKIIIPHSRPSFSNKEVVAVKKILRMQIKNETIVNNLERDIAKICNQKFALATSSGTAALHLALKALGIRAGDEVIMPTYVCQSLLQATLYLGGIPRFVDVDFDTFNIDYNQIIKKINRKVKAIIVPHMFGLMADIEKIKKIGIPLVEDCAMSVGSSFNGKLAGSFGDLIIFSFYWTKMISAGQGGAVATSDSRLAEKIEQWREYDVPGKFMARYNYKIDPLSAAVAQVQLKKLPIFIKKRKAITKKYNQAFSKLKLFLPVVPADFDHVFYRYVVKCPFKNTSILRNKLNQVGVQCGSGVRQNLHTLVKGTTGNFPVADRLVRETLSIPIYPDLTVKEQDFVINQLIYLLS